MQSNNKLGKAGIMTQKSIGWIALYTCVIAVAVAVFDGHRPEPQTARPRLRRSRRRCLPMSPRRAAVINQMVMIQRITADEMHNRQEIPADV